MWFQELNRLPRWLSGKESKEPGGLQSIGLQTVRHDWACTHRGAGQTSNKAYSWTQNKNSRCKGRHNFCLRAVALPGRSSQWPARPLPACPSHMEAFGTVRTQIVSLIPPTWESFNEENTKCLLCGKLWEVKGVTHIFWKSNLHNKLVEQIFSLSDEEIRLKEVKESCGHTNA